MFRWNFDHTTWGRFHACVVWILGSCPKKRSKSITFYFFPKNFRWKWCSWNYFAMFSTTRDHTSTWQCRCGVGIFSATICGQYVRWDMSVTVNCVLLPLHSHVLLTLLSLWAECQTTSVDRKKMRRRPTCWLCSVWMWPDPPPNIPLGGFLGQLAGVILGGSPFKLTWRVDLTRCHLSSDLQRSRRRGFLSFFLLGWEVNLTSAPCQVPLVKFHLCSNASVGLCLEVWKFHKNSRWLNLALISWYLLMRPLRLGTKGANLQEIPHTNLPLLVNQSFLVQEQNYKLALLKLTKRQA